MKTKQTETFDSKPWELCPCAIQKMKKSLKIRPTLLKEVWEEAEAGAQWWIDAMAAIQHPNAAEAAKKMERLKELYTQNWAIWNQIASEQDKYTFPEPPEGTEGWHGCWRECKIGPFEPWVGIEAFTCEGCGETTYAFFPQLSVYTPKGEKNPDYWKAWKTAQFPQWTPLVEHGTQRQKEWLCAKPGDLFPPNIRINWAEDDNEAGLAHLTH